MKIFTSANHKTGRYPKASWSLAIATLGLLTAAGCHTDMWVQPKPGPQSESDFFPDGTNNRPPIAHVVDRDHLKTDDVYWRGIKGVNMVNGKPAGAVFTDELPEAMFARPEFHSESGDRAESLAKILDRGQDRFNIFCSPCHGELGDGNGMIAKRGFSLRVPPRNYHTDRLRTIPLGHFFDVITNGDGAMTPRAFQVEPSDRWAIAAYIRVLQFSQHADPTLLKPEETSKIDAMPQVAEPPKTGAVGTEDFKMSAKKPLPPSLEKVSKAGPAIFMIGLIGFVVGILNLHTPHWEYFYLYAWIMAMTFSLGCLGFSLLHYCVKGLWGYPVIRIWEAGGRLLPFLAIVGLPLWFKRADLYPWAQQHVTDPKMLARVAYMNSMGVLIRAIFYFAIWTGASYHLSSISRRLDDNPDVSMLRGRTNLSAFLLVIFVLTVNFAYTDWVMSLEPHWYSTIFGLWFVVSAAICAVGFVSLLTMLCRQDEPYKTEITVGVRKDFGNLMLLCVMLWGYFSFSQWVIIWSGNLPDEIEFYLHRFSGPWLYIGATIVVFQFFGPFLALLSGKTKRFPLLVGSIATWLLFMRFVDIGWTIFPSLEGASIAYLIVGILLAVAFMGVWVTAVVEQLRGAKLVTFLIPEPVEEIMEHA